MATTRVGGWCAMSTLDKEPSMKPIDNIAIIERCDPQQVHDFLYEPDYGCYAYSPELWPWDHKTTWPLTIDNRGLDCRLRRNWRLIWRDHIWYGWETRRVVLRVWHDGSITIEHDD